MRSVFSINWIFKSGSVFTELKRLHRKS